MSWLIKRIKTAAYLTLHNYFYQPVVACGLLVQFPDCQVSHHKPRDAAESGRPSALSAGVTGQSRPGTEVLTGESLRLPPRESPDNTCKCTEQRWEHTSEKWTASIDYHCFIRGWLFLFSLLCNLKGNFESVGLWKRVKQVHVHDKMRW